MDNEKYFVIEIVEGDSKIAGKAIYDFDTKKEAVTRFHKDMEMLRKSELCTGCLIQVIDYATGNDIENEKYTA